MTPAISVLIAVHNGLPYVESALRSVMEQTFRDIEIVVVDDASTDATPEVLARLAAEDPRIRVETLATNLRLPGALNRGLELVRAPLVARMDADDIAHPTRLAVQKAYMDAHPEVTMVTASVRKIHSDGRLLAAPVRQPLNPRAMRWMLRLGMPACHPTYLFRRCDPDGQPWRYDPTWSASEDYDLLERMTRRGRVVCLADILLDYRVHGGSITGQADSLHLRQGRAIGVRVLQSDLPPDIAAAMMPYLDVNFRQRRIDRAEAAALVRGMAAMLRHDARHDSDLLWWYRRMAARRLVTRLREMDIPSRTILSLILRHAPGLIPGLALRTAENRRWLKPAAAVQMEV